jgi:hypothetical protein
MSSREAALLYRVRQDLDAPQAIDARQKKIRELFLVAESAANEEAPTVVEQITGEIENELRFEEDFLFPIIRMRGSRHAQHVVDEAIGDHEVIRMLIQRMQRKEEDFRRLLSRLHQEIAHHFREQHGMVALVRSCLK